jgi:hypothetical protein
MQKNACALFYNWRQLFTVRIGKGVHEVERSAEPCGEVANAMPYYRYGQNEPPAASRRQCSSLALFSGIR